MTYIALSNASQQKPLAYRGRFAPSPTGPLHFGSLVAALGSFLDARARGGEWLVRIEDLDSPRQAPGAAAAILKILDVCGLHWDGRVMYQHTRQNEYQAAARHLLDSNFAYTCTCSRREVADSSVSGLDGPIYPGTCRQGPQKRSRTPAIRLRVPQGCGIEFMDTLQGLVTQQLATQIGDFIIYRADGYAAYQLSVVLDDAYQGITHVVRGADLLISTPRQIYLQQLFGLQSPAYMHLPVALNVAGEKISKQAGARPVDEKSPGRELHRVLRFLGQQPPINMHDAPPHELLSWAVSHWYPERVAGVSQRKIDQ